MRPSRWELYKRLRGRAEAPEGVESFDRSMWDELGCELTILVSDLSGFTRQTKARGVLQFLAVHCRCIDISMVVIERYGGEMVKTEADNFIASFPEPAVAVRAALDLCADSWRQNRDLPLYEQVRPCLGIGHGEVLRLADDVFGDAVNVAYKLGEDIARPYEILVAESTIPQLASCDVPLGDRLVAETAGVPLAYRRIRYQPPEE